MRKIIVQKEIKLFERNYPAALLTATFKNYGFVDF